MPNTTGFNDVDTLDQQQFTQQETGLNAVANRSISEQIASASRSGRFDTIFVGSGNYSFKSDSQGSWWGAELFDDAPAKVAMDGTAEFTDLTITGGTIQFGKTSFSDSTNAGYILTSEGFYMGSASDASFLKYTISSGNLELKGAIVNTPTLVGLSSDSSTAYSRWLLTSAFSAPTYNSVAWSAGTLTLTSGASYLIGAGSKTGLSGTNYIYFDKAVSEIALQTTTTAANAVGADKLLVAVASPNADTGSQAFFQVFGGSGGIRILSDQLATNSVTANAITAGTITTAEIASNTITAGNIAAGAVKASEIDTDAVTAVKIAANAVEADKIKAGAVTATKISVSTLSAITANLGTITAGAISGTTLTLPYSTLATTGYLSWVNNSNKIWVDSSQYMGLQANGDRHYFYHSSTLYALFQLGSQAVFYDGVYSSGNFNCTGNARIHGNPIYLSSSGTLAQINQDYYIGQSGYFIDFTTSGGAIWFGQSLIPNSTAYNIGSSSQYWNNVHYHALVAHSFKSYDNGVTMRDGTVIKSDLEALRMIKDSELADDKGRTYLDKRSFPVEMFVPAQDAEGNEFERNEKDYPMIVKKKSKLSMKEGEVEDTTPREEPFADGVDMVQFVSLIFGAVKEIADKVDDMEKRLSSLEKVK